MKKIITIMLVLMMAVIGLAACGSSDGGGSDSGAPASIDSVKTIGDVIALESDETQSAVYDNKVVYAFKLGDTYYRARATLSDEEQQAYFDIEFDDPDYEEKQNAIVSPLAIDEIENLSEQIPGQDELDAYVGKTGQELMDAGWNFTGHNLEDMEFWMDYGPFEYTVVFDGEVAEADYENFMDEEGTKDMTVKSVVYNGLGDATNIE